MKSVHKLHLAPCHRFLKLPTDLDHLRIVSSLYVKGEGRSFKYEVNFAVGVNSLLLSQRIRSCLWNVIKPLQCRPHTLSLPPFQSWCCSAHQIPAWTGRGKATAARAAGLHPRGKKPNKSTEKKHRMVLDRVQNRYYTGKGLACDRNPLCNLKHLAHYCYCCSLFLNGLLHFSTIGMWKQTMKNLFVTSSKETPS